MNALSEFHRVKCGSGRSFAGDELATGAKVALVGSVIIEELFEGRAGVGETLRIGNVPFTVIGVLAKKGLGASGRSQGDVVFIPLSTAKSRVLGAVRGTTEAVDFISIKASDATTLSEVESEEWITSLGAQGLAIDCSIGRSPGASPLRIRSTYHAERLTRGT